MKLIDALKFPFQGPHAWPNLGCLTLCFLIPFVGPIVALGFQCEVEKYLVLNPTGPQPRFDFGKFGLYLRRGVAPFVVSLLATLVLFPLLFLLIFGVIFGITLSHEQPLVAVLLFVAAFFIWLFIALLFSAFASPIIFRAMVEQNIGAAFGASYLIDYYKRVGLLTLGMEFLVMAITMPLIVVMCIPFIQYGIFAALMAVQSHLRAQLYLAFLDRGGQPLDIMPDLSEAGFPVIVAPQTM
jgi:hypothetical protein